MKWIYLLAVNLYVILIRMAAPFHTKAALWVNGRKDIFKKIHHQLREVHAERIWIHCASLGEFEQAVPLIEKLKQKYPSRKIVLTFFSPSGYELKKNTTLADAVFYLPADSPLSAKTFLELINPVMAFFIKYEFWHFYISELYRRNIPLYIVSARFGKQHIFFKWYGKFFLGMLQKATRIFVQDHFSLQLCTAAGLKNCSVSGDTRFDRVMEIAANPKQFPEIAKFCSDKKIFIAGSTWPEDEKLITELIHHIHDDWKFIIAPHEISEKHISQLISGIRKKTVRYSQLDQQEYEVLIIDNIGMLSSVYQYGNIAYVGGGLGRGLHNILEPAAFGLPVIFGNKIRKNTEAFQMIENGTGYAVKDSQTLIRVFNQIEQNFKNATSLNTMQKDFIRRNSGAVNRMINLLP
jgi:3-deoxy-D-manno-octulosonic-acid transferase